MASEGGCPICSAELIYSPITERQVCALCREGCDSNARCLAGHCVCDACHTLAPSGWIIQACQASTSTDPMAIAQSLMSHASVKMHGPEHHQLVAAALITAATNARGEREALASRLAEVSLRSKRLPGGFCGSHGACGAGIAAGVFVSVLTGATPMATRLWAMSNEMTARALLAIAAQGGPRCCKRCSALAITAATEFARAELGIALQQGTRFECGFSERNRQCQLAACPHHQSQPSRAGR